MKIVPRSVLWLPFLLLVAASADARSLRDQLGQSSLTVGLAGGGAFDALAENIAETAARSLPVVSASAGFTYRYNKELDIFERTSDTLGPIFLERPDTLGKGKLNVNVSFQYVQFDEFDGQSLNRLRNTDPIVIRVADVAGNTVGFTANQLRYGLKIQNYITAFSLTYGIFDDLDVNLLVPVIETNLDVGVRSKQVALAGPDAVFAPAPAPQATGFTHGVALGVGDILLRLKYRLAEWHDIRSAAGLQLRLPSGDENDFQGTGSFEASPFFYASTVYFSRLEPFVNAGVDLRADSVERSEARYGIGADYDATRRVGLTLAFLGRSEFKGSASPSETNFLHLRPSGAVAEEPLLGLSFGRKDFLDLSFGTRIVVWHDVMLFANGIYALNNDGLRNDTIIPTVGFEGTF